MAKTHPILTLLLALALMLQSYGEVGAHDNGCCPGDCPSDPAYCMALATGSSCGACQAAVFDASALNAWGSGNTRVSAFDYYANGYISTQDNTIWRPPIATSFSSNFLLFNPTMRFL
jgi:hypothetical protein